MAIEAAKVAKIFDGKEDEPWSESDAVDIDGSSSIKNSEQGMQMTMAEDIWNLLLWKQQMAEDVHKQNPAMDPVCTSFEDTTSNGDVNMLQDPNMLSEARGEVWYEGNTEMAEQSLSPVDPACLHYDQYHAYDIIIVHLNTTLAGQCLPPLHMLIHGEPGTGKSKAIQTVTEHFVHRGARFMFQKAAYTGITALLIDGKTMHTIAMISQWKDGVLSAECKGKLQTHWKHIQYLIIDEVSMISKTFLAKLSQNISIGKMAEEDIPSPHSFRGISVILCGDFFQFPPVACAPSEALYFPHNYHSAQSRR